MALLRNSLVELRSRNGELHEWVLVEADGRVAQRRVHKGSATPMSPLSGGRLDRFIECFNQKIHESSYLAGKSSAGRIDSVEV